MGIVLLAACLGTTRTAEAPAPTPREESGESEVPDVQEQGGLYAAVTHDVALTLSDAAIAALATDADEDVEDVPGTFTWNGESWPVGVQLKGGNGSFRRFDQKPSFRLDFGEYRPEGALEGARWLILNNLVQDQSMLAEHAAYAVYGALDVPAPRHGYARVTVNGELFGLYGLLEDVRPDFVARRWPGDADGVLLDGGEDLLPGAEEGFKMLQGDDLAPLTAMIEALDAADADTYADTLATWFDEERLLRQWAIEIATGNADAYATRHNNYFLYWAPREAAWTMIPWGTDTAFLTPLPLWGEEYEGELYRNCLGAPACEAALRGALAEVLAWWETGALAATMEEVDARTLEDCLADPRSEAGRDGCTAGRAAFWDFVAGRPAELRGLLGG